jgi:cytochrome c-type biogenesis protein
MIGSAPMWTVVVVLPTVQAEFGTLRAGASLPYTMTMVGFMVGGVLMVAVGVALVTGLWNDFTSWVRDAFVSDVRLPI